MLQAQALPCGHTWRSVGGTYFQVLGGCHLDCQCLDGREHAGARREKQTRSAPPLSTAVYQPSVLAKGCVCGAFAGMARTGWFMAQSGRIQLAGRRCCDDEKCQEMGGQPFYRSSHPVQQPLPHAGPRVAPSVRVGCPSSRLGSAAWAGLARRLGITNLKRLAWAATGTAASAAESWSSW